tara:strand:+ start:122968 stop:124212 length:1245 start_codon:yes stop_codon:yes gene_type:complete
MQSRPSSGASIRMSDLGHPIAAGLIAALTGFASSFTLVIAGLVAVGATPAQAASGLFALSLGQGILCIALSLAFRLPLAFAWSTPGAAVMIAAGGLTGDFASAIGAFLVCAALLLLTGFWPALARAMTRIPPAIGSAMLAGILVPICLAPVQAAVELPALALPAVIVWALLARLAPRWAVAGAVVATIAAIIVSGRASGFGEYSLAPTLEFVMPHLDPLVIVSLGVPLYLVTMAGQNVPGFAVLRTFGYHEPPARAILLSTGAASAITSPFGGYVLNLAAITAAMMAGPDAHADARRRWIATLACGVAYLALAFGASAASALVAVAPPILITAVAGLALFGAFGSSIADALREPAHRVVAVLTFLVVVSGVTIAGIGSAFWGLVVGGLAYLWLVLSRRPRQSVDDTVAASRTGS